jgi:hypothetical protein
VRAVSRRKSLDDPAVTPPFAGFRDVGLQQYPCFSSRCAGLFPFLISVSSCSRSSALNLTTYRFTEISFAAMVPSAANNGDKSESLNPFMLVEADD